MPKEDKKILEKTKEEKPINDNKPKLVTEFITRASYLRQAPRKIRLVADFVKGKKLQDALDQLAFNPRRASRFLIKVLKAAKANGEHNYNLKADELMVKNIIVDGGPTLHRFRPAAHGSAHPVRKRTSHLIICLKKIVVAEKIEKKSKAKRGKVESKNLLKKISLGKVKSKVKK
jgi:large subunit ribosomal protein L22